MKGEDGNHVAFCKQTKEKKKKMKKRNRTRSFSRGTFKSTRHMTWTPDAEEEKKEKKMKRNEKQRKKETSQQPNQVGGGSITESIRHPAFSREGG